MEGFAVDFSGLITSVPVIGVMAWVISWLSTELKDERDDHDRLRAEYISHLKAEKERDKLIQAELSLGRQFDQATMHRWREIDTQRIPTPAEIDAALQSPSSDT